MTTDNGTIVEGNKLIAEFDGYIYDPEATLNGIRGVLMKEGKLSMHLNFSEPYHPKYHSSWECLMDAWKKFFNEIILSEWYKDYMDKESNFELQCMEYSLQSANLSAAYKHFVNLLNWYNSTQSIHQSSQ